VKATIFAGALVLAVTGCDKRQEASQPFSLADKGGYSVSQLQLRIDTGTGCHYLVTSSGGITPRLDGQGKHVGCKP